MFHIDICIIDQYVFFVVKEIFKFFIENEKNEYANVMLRIESIVEHVNEHFLEIVYRKQIHNVTFFFVEKDFVVVFIVKFAIKNDVVFIQFIYTINEICTNIIDHVFTFFFFAFDYLMYSFFLLHKANTIFFVQI